MQWRYLVTLALLVVTATAIADDEFIAAFIEGEQGNLLCSRPPDIKLGHGDVYTAPAVEADAEQISIPVIDSCTEKGNERVRSIWVQCDTEYKVSSRSFREWGIRGVLYGFDTNGARHVFLCRHAVGCKDAPFLDDGAIFSVKNGRFACNSGRQNLTFLVSATTDGAENVRLLLSKDEW